MTDLTEFNSSKYSPEISIMDSLYPLALEYIKSIKEQLQKKGEREEYLDTAIIGILGKADLAEIEAELKKILEKDVPPPKFIYFKEDEKEEYKVCVRDGKLCFNKSGLPVDSDGVFRQFFSRTWKGDECFLEKIGYPVPEARKGKAEKSCYIVDASNQLYIFPYRSNTIHHSSLTRGNPVILAGTIVVKDGKILYIDNSTGHYQSSYQSLMRILETLRELCTKPEDLSSLFSSEFTYDSIGVLVYGREKPKDEEIRDFRIQFIDAIKGKLKLAVKIQSLLNITNLDEIKTSMATKEQLFDFLIQQNQLKPILETRTLDGSEMTNTDYTTPTPTPKQTVSGLVQKALKRTREETNDPLELGATYGSDDESMEQNKSMGVDEGVEPPETNDPLGLGAIYGSDDESMEQNESTEVDEGVEPPASKKPHPCPGMY